MIFDNWIYSIYMQNDGRRNVVFDWQTKKKKNEENQKYCELHENVWADVWMTAYFHFPHQDEALS